MKAEGYNRSMKKLTFLAVGMVLVFFSCASLRFEQREADIMKIISLINGGDSAKLAEVSETPFLLDDEIIMLEGDISTLWTNITAAGFTIAGPDVYLIEQKGEDSYSTFGESMEVESFFSKYLPNTARIARVEGDNVKLLLLVNDKVEGYPKIHGIKVY